MNNIFSPKLPSKKFHPTNVFEERVYIEQGLVGRKHVETRPQKRVIPTNAYEAKILQEEGFIRKKVLVKDNGTLHERIQKSFEPVVGVKLCVQPDQYPHGEREHRKRMFVHPLHEVSLEYTPRGKRVHI